jgi:hypothetical protein
MTTLQKLNEADHRPKGLLQVMACYKRELLKISV